MIKTDLFRRFDELGRINIPREVRKQALGTTVTEGKCMEIFYEKDGTIILKPVKDSEV